MPRRTRDAAIGLLVVLNVVLLCTVLTYVMALPKANAQAAPQAGGGQFLAVTGEVQSGLDAMYIVDLNSQVLYSLAPIRTGSGVVMQATDRRDLRAAFSRQPTPTVPPRGR